MNEKKLVHNFKSYLGLEDTSFKINNDKVIPIEELKPKLLLGELVIGTAHNVLMYAPVTEQQKGRLGSLFVTNYKLSFVTSDDQVLGGCRQQSRILGPHDIPLSLVGSVTELVGDEESSNALSWGQRKRLLRPHQPLPRRVQGLQVLCKNMRVLSFGFKFSASGQGRGIAAALLHHAFPRRHHLLFAYEYSQPYHLPQELAEINMYSKATDWKKEMDRTNCQNWRLSRANIAEDSFFSGAGEALVVPSTVLDCQLAEAARHFRKGRVPVWVWSSPCGAALVRSGELYAGSAAQSGSTAGGAPAHAPESVLLEAARRAHPEKVAPRPLQLPTHSLRNTYKRLATLCAPTTLRTFWEQDGKFYSSLEATKWLKYVSESLYLASEAADTLSKNITVVLQEGDGMDYCAVVSSLTQLLLDSHFRTITGFQSLIQKEWVALGHPFCDRLGHVALEESEMTEGEKEMSPVFLLFLDCCWQLQLQFPSSFQFTDAYLATLWDSAHNQLFHTFLFNSPRDREIAMFKHSNMRPVWDWHEQFTDEEIQYFYNPLYSPPSHPTHPPKSVIPQTAIRLPGLASPVRSSGPESLGLTPSPQRLVPNISLPSLELWRTCYMRWLPPLHLPGSGDVQYLLHHMRLVKEIHTLQEKVNASTLRRSNGSKENYVVEDLNVPHPSTVGAFFPFIGVTSMEHVSPPSDSTSTENLDVCEQQFDSQSILNGPDY